MPSMRKRDHHPTPEEAQAKFFSGKWLKHGYRNGETVWKDPKTDIVVELDERAAFSSDPDAWRQKKQLSAMAVPLAIVAAAGGAFVWWLWRRRS